MEQKERYLFIGHTNNCDIATVMGTQAIENLDNMPDKEFKRMTLRKLNEAQENIDRPGEGAHISNPSCSGGTQFEASPGKNVRPYLNKW
jgi:hypothetical protein